MMAHRNTVHALPLHALPLHALPLIAWRALWLTLLGLMALLLPIGMAQAAKPFPVDQFSYYLSDYDYELAKLAKDLKKTETELLTDIQAAETAGNARLTAASIEQLLTKRPSDGALWLKLARQLAISTPISDSDGYQISSKMIGGRGVRIGPAS